MHRSTTRPAVSVATTLAIDEAIFRSPRPRSAMPCGLPREQARCAKLHLAVRDHPLDRLLIGQLGTEGLALPGPVDGDLQRGLSDPDGSGRIRDAPLDQPLFADGESLPLFPESVVDRDLDVLEGDLVRCVRADDRNLLEAHALGVAGHDEAGDAAAVALLARAGENESPVGALRARDPHLAAVEDVSIALSHRAGANRARRVGSARSLADGDVDLFARPNAGNGVLLDLLRGAEVDRVRRVRAEARRTQARRRPSGTWRPPPRPRPVPAGSGPRRRIRPASARTTTRCRVLCVCSLSRVSAGSS